MRRLVLATAMLGMTFGAQAADISDLPNSSRQRGSQPQLLLQELGRLVCRRPCQLLLLRDGFQPRRQVADRFHGARQRCCRSRSRIGNCYPRIPRSPWLRRLRRPQLAMGRPRVRLRGQLHFLSSLQSSSTNSMRRLIVNPAGDPPPGYTVTYDTTLTAPRREHLIRAAPGVGSALPIYSAAWLRAHRRVRAATVSLDKYVDRTDRFGVINPDSVLRLRPRSAPGAHQTSLWLQRRGSRHGIQLVGQRVHARRVGIFRLEDQGHRSRPTTCASAWATSSDRAWRAAVIDMK